MGPIGGQQPGRVALLRERAASGALDVPTSPRRFGQLPDLAVRDDFDNPLSETELDMWEGRAEEA
ncbi:hypothetical protein [Mycobacterium sp. 236(2023)]|uniref:hypothetical protein n=1 Tax=Mycobacterium sp. 236(2023) TaxID=3038163 RepID=UPI0024153AB3|nr:hypothetical protein [Mycobacterium sp. 236(2023)]MDG4666354.1 hypothetical protein [Mycobacterium sp. 236(2023)]